MTAPTYAEFGAATEGAEVAKAFGDNVRGKTIIITGVNRTGLGFSIAHALASQSPARIIVTGRTVTKLQESIDALKADFPSIDYRWLQIDLSSQQAVRKAAAEFLAWSDVPTLDILINNAGIMSLPELTLSEDGIEMQMATNHLGHWLFASLVMPKLIKAAEGKPKGATRIVSVSSVAAFYSGLRWSDLYFEKSNKDLPQEEQPVYELLKAWDYEDVENAKYVPLDAYCRSKAANVLFAIGANKRLYEKYGILTMAVHPGTIYTELARSMLGPTMNAFGALVENGTLPIKSFAAGSSTTLVAALDPKLTGGETRDGKENYGVFLCDCQISDKAHPLAVSSSEAEKVWKLSESWVGQEFAW